MFSVYIYLAGLLTGVSIAYTLIELYDLDNHPKLAIISEPQKKVCECSEKKTKWEFWSVSDRYCLGALVSYLKAIIVHY